MRDVQPSTGLLDIDKRIITSGASVVICNGYTHATMRYDCSLRVKAKHVIEGPITEVVHYHGKPLKSQPEKMVAKGGRNRTRTLTRQYKATNVMINVGKIGLVIGRNKHLQSNWDVLIDGIVYAVSPKLIKLLETPEDIALVERRARNKPVNAKVH